MLTDPNPDDPLVPEIAHVSEVTPGCFPRSEKPFSAWEVVFVDSS